MTRRYEIQDILSQDADGVVFHAVDRESGRDAVLRRFFPRGRDGGGLNAEEQEEFLQSVEKLKKVEHKCLRKVLDGGCDPVDGMPFLVTEWVEGTSVADFLAGNALEADSVKGLVDVALDTSAELSRALGQENLWVDCGPQALMVPETGRGISFWVLPFRTGSNRGLLPLAKLAEHMLRWDGRPQPDWAGDGLAGWIQHIRANPSGWNLAEATEALHRPQEATPTGQVRHAPGAVTMTTPVVRFRKRKNRTWPWMVTTAVVVLTGAFAFWKFDGIGGIERRLKGPAAVQADLRAEMLKDLESKAPPAEEPLAWNAQGPAPAGQVPSSSLVPKPPVPPPAPAAVIPPAAEPPLVTPAPKPPPPSRPVDPANSLFGKVIDASKSSTGKTRYLEVFVGGQTRWIGYQVAGSEPGLEMSDFESLVGKRVVATGKFKTEKSYRGEVLHITKRDQIEVQP